MRLRRRPDFVLVQSTGRKIHGKHFLAMVIVGGAECTQQLGRVGLTVTKRIGNAVTRNRIKRRARDWLRRNGWVPAGRDVVFVAKESAATSTSTSLGEDLARMASRIASC